MAKSIARLFRDPQSAEKAIHELQAKGFNAKEIGILLRQREDAHKLLSAVKGATSAQGTLPEAGTVVGTGPLSPALKEADPGAALTEALSITAEAYEYYRFGILAGGILVSVTADEKRLEEAKSILKKATPQPQLQQTGAKSPGFAKAERMSATNPIDAPMSGDFRKY